MFVNQWTSYPAGVIAGAALEVGAPTWIRETKMIGSADATEDVPAGHLEVDTRVDVPVPGSGGHRAEMVLDGDPSRYAYGLPIFLALLLAARQKKMLGKAIAGYLLLLPFQAFTLAFFILLQIVVSTNIDLAQLRLNAWQVEGIVYGFQFGTLVVPTLLPILIWLWLDRRFFVDVIAKSVTAPKRK
ncbi:hypothetical protein E9531_05620 [Lampropedia puyangensis]|uniref:Uncharacterized protein n=2 Tax=Lampropedia puyangensis TaxID=1330072 RepID=A0A4S8FD68_9BURK|nr:hypothetical protein E9531_05620 [Lampropedia puyangensis]